ncbi:MAG: alpha/beta hydrolase [Armatimonadetes bacterium]|nr:alpha/beta hydrolase [Armatimonadota bacterium]
MSILITSVILGLIGSAAGSPDPSKPAVGAGLPSAPAATPKDPFIHVPDEVFLSMLRNDPQAVMGKIPQSVTYRYHETIARLDQGFTLYGDTFYRERKPAKRRPALVFVHDAAGFRQPVSAGERQCAYLALTENLFCVSLYYRQPTDAYFPAALQDLKCCLRWLRSIADDYAIAPDRLIALGSSAGTQYTWLAAATNGSKECEGSGGYDGYSSDLNLALLNAAMCDFVTDFGRQGFGSKIMGGTLEEMPERYREASPLHRLRAGMPPVLMIHGDQDTSCPLRSARAAYQRLQELKVPSELVVREGRGHGTGGFNTDLCENLDTMRRFIRRYFPE